MAAAAAHHHAQAHANHGHHAPPPPQYYGQDQQGAQQAQGDDQQNQGNASQMPEIRSLLNTPAGGSPASVADGVEEQQQHSMDGADVGGSPRERREVYHAQA